MTDECILCLGRAGDDQLGRVQVWEDDLWRLTTSVGPDDPTAGFSYLEPKRHIPYVSNLDGEEAGTFGPILARVTSALRDATGTELVYVYVFGGGIPHLHVHLAPHKEGDALNDRMIRGEIREETLPSGATRLVSRDFPAVEQGELRATADRIRAILSSPAS